MTAVDNCLTGVVEALGSVKLTEVQTIKLLSEAKEDNVNIMFDYYCSPGNFFILCNLSS